MSHAENGWIVIVLLVCIGALLVHMMRVRRQRWEDAQRREDQFRKAVEADKVYWQERMREAIEANRKSITERQSLQDAISANLTTAWAIPAAIHLQKAVSAAEQSMKQAEAARQRAADPMNSAQFASIRDPRLDYDPYAGARIESSARGHGGSFDGGGASGDYGRTETCSAPSPSSHSSDSSSSSSCSSSDSGSSSGSSD
jgi:hypothetical protein